MQKQGKVLPALNATPNSILISNGNYFNQLCDSCWEGSRGSLYLCFLNTNKKVVSTVSTLHSEPSVLKLISKLSIFRPVLLQ
jgi:hypothetical protein